MSLTANQPHHIPSCCKAINKDWLWPIFEIADTQLAFEIETPGVQVAISCQRHGMLRSAGYLLELEWLLLAAVISTNRLEYLLNDTWLFGTSIVLLACAADAELSVRI